MSRQGGVKKLLKYVNEKEKADHTPLLWNLQSDKNNLKDITQEFLENGQYLKTRKNGTILFHEIISFNGLDKQKITPATLLDVAREYLSLRADKALAYAMPHFDEADNPHIHIVISANGYREKQRIRLDKFQFQDIKKQLENYQREKYPELSHSRVKHDNAGSRSEKIKKKRGEREKKRRERGEGRKPNKKELLAQKMRQTLFHALSFAEFEALLKNEGFRQYQRGKHYGIVNLETGRKHRFATLGIQELYFRRIEQWKRAREHLYGIENIAFQKSLKFWRGFGFKEDLLQTIAETPETPREEEFRRLYSQKRARTRIRSVKNRDLNF